MNDPDVTPLYTHPAPSQEQEPVAYKHEIYINKRCVETWYDEFKNPAADTKIIPLYTHPAQPLSDDEIEQIIADEQIPVRTGKTAKRFARAIEKAIMEKNSG